MRVFFVIMAFFLCPQTFASDDTALSLLMRPTRGGIERGIPGLLSGQRPNSPIGYFVAVFGKKNINPQKPTHVVVTGHGGAAGTLFQNSAASRARKYAEVFKNHQVVLVAVNEMDGDTNIPLLQAWGFRVLAAREQKLSVRLLMWEMRDLKKLVSFDLYSHSNEISGAALDEDFLSKDSYETEFLSERFLPQAWASLHGCNSAFQLAPALAGLWRVPVSGSMTATHFQHLHERGSFYPYDELMAPPGRFAETNTLSFSKEQSCRQAGCQRMHPDPYPYWGEWGKANHGLGFYKFFCGPVRAADCEIRMARSLLGYLGRVNLHMGSSDADFLTVLKEYMCPIHKENLVLEDCEKGIDRALATADEHYTPFLGRSSICDERECREPQAGERSAEFMRTVKAFVRGFRGLRSEP